jgi:hypothetical protein
LLDLQPEDRKNIIKTVYSDAIEWLLKNGAVYIAKNASTKELTVCLFDNLFFEESSLMVLI